MDYFAIISDNGELYFCGDNYNNKVTLDNYYDVDISTGVSTSLPILQVSCGDNHSAIITADKRLYVSGDNIYSKLGLDKSGGVDSFTRVPTDLQFSQVVCTDKFTIAL